MPAKSDEPPQVFRYSLRTLVLVMLSSGPIAAAFRWTAREVNPESAWALAAAVVGAWLCVVATRSVKSP
jgi:hypothetical protein